MPSTLCPDCDGRIRFNPHATLGQKLACPHCGSNLEVIATDPLELDWAYDWSWDDDEEEEDE